LLSEIITEVSRYKKVNLGEREAQFLSRIGEGVNSSYKIFALLKQMETPMDYTNVNKRVKRLRELGLIKEAKDESLHNAKFYELTSEGLFYLLAGGWRVDISWIKKYKDDMILKYLLEPYFEEKTILFYGIDLEISEYLKQCCQMILSCVEALQSKSISKHPSRKTVQDLILKQLKIDLEWQAKSLAFKLVTKKTDFWYIFNKARTSLTGPEVADYFSFDLTRYQNLAKDERFMKLSKNLGKEYEEAFSKLLQLLKRN
jgi:hypothetical protein